MKILKNKAQIGRKGTVVTQSPTGGQPITIAPQNLIRDPRAKSSIVAPSTGGSVYKGNRVRMTADELRMARELGINDEASLKKYAAEIQKSKRG